jgi:hypothetical protein
MLLQHTPRHQVQAEASARGHLPEIIRNAGASGCRDIHLEDFNLSNGTMSAILKNLQDHPCRYSYFNV